MKTLGQHIRERRESKDISLREFARKLGHLSPPFVSDIELGRRFPSEKVLGRIAEVLDESIDQLKQYDSRPPLDELKRLAAADPTYGFALRKVVDGEISAEDLMKLADRKKSKR